ncbi:iron uptake transporter deferrochelatase/peroxidase subunit [Actinoplanes sp. NPDC051411]|uniref:iron uptake transporter deferrochelatase/peroxidase subunit n=1 Tax=Actinoplanes sp. NPDC051411 TaxID=3155522 RepID=UPI003419004C
MSTNRRNFLRGIGAGAAGLAISPRAFHEDAPSAVAFHGVHQAGIVTPPQAQASHVAFDLIVDNRQDLTDLFHTITDRARFLTTGGTPPEVGIAGPPTDSGVVGPSVSPDNLTVTVGVGASMFDQRFGLAAHKPEALTAMPMFPDDHLDPARTHGDLSLQLCADNRDTVVHALRDIARHTRGGMQIRWRADGFVNPPRPEGTPRNLMGFKDGTSNLEITVPAQMDRFVWLPAAAEQPWTAGGSYQVIRVIRMLVEFWDRVSIVEQERMFGRRRDSGAPLDGNHEKDIPNFAADPVGEAIPLTAHMRRANPRTPESAESRILRRPYNYDKGVDDVGNLDQGLVFVCFQQDPDKQFAEIQRRLEGEPLVDYIQPVGGGYFLVLPGVRDASDYLGSAVLSLA